ncbi:MAG TPA: Fe-S cluster assembly scaffold protein NifU [Anaerolineae bacterium]|nr:Fe-S cluster assembly scaffold protein NifU [Anaerolineae bacterium]
MGSYLRYSEQVLEHFMNPRNVGVIPNADGVGRKGNPVCGDVMEIFIKVNDEGIIEDIKFRTFGCGAAVATSSITTEMVKGKHISEARRITKQAIAEALGGLPPIKMHCSVLAADALNAAIDDYEKRKRGEAGVQPVESIFEIVSKDEE